MAEPKRMDLKSMSISEDQKTKLKQIFPEVFNEDKIDFDKLRLTLGEEIDEGEERFGMTWPGKNDCFKVIQNPSIGTLKPAKQESVDWDSTENLFIEGDNLEVLKLLQRSYYGKVKMIYIDPPYNTGKEFVYPDNYTESLDTYLAYSGQTDEEGYRFSTNTEAEGRFHSKWMSMMYPRLFLANNLLRKDGVIFISIDDNEIHNLKSMMCDIFGEENILGIISNTNNPKGRSDDKFIATAHEYILVTAKNKSQARFYGFEPDFKITKRYNKKDTKGKSFREIDLRKTGDADRREDRPDMFYYFYYNKQQDSLRVSKEKNCRHGETEIIPLRDDDKEGRWRWGFSNAEENLDKLFAKFMPNRKIWGVFEIDYLEHRPPVKSTSSWTFKDVNSERGSEQFIELDFEKEVFPRPKPIGTMRRVIELGTLPNEHSIILDFFAGSCSLCHAAFSLLDENTRNLVTGQLWVGKGGL